MGWTIVKVLSNSLTDDFNNHFKGKSISKVNEMTAYESEAIIFLESFVTLTSKHTDEFACYLYEEDKKYKISSIKHSRQFVDFELFPPALPTGDEYRTYEHGDVINLELETSDLSVFLENWVLLNEDGR
jgi:hypothetical protein